MYRVLESRSPKSISQIRPRVNSLFSWSVEQNTRDTQMNTRMTEGESFIPGGSSLRSNPFPGEWCPFRIPTNSKSSYHFFVAIRCIEVFKNTTLINTLMIIFSTLSKVPLPGRAFRIGRHRKYSRAKRWPRPLLITGRHISRVLSVSKCRIEYWSDDLIKMKFVQLCDLLRYSERTTSKTPTRQKLAIRGKFSLRY